MEKKNNKVDLEKANINNSRIAILIDKIYKSLIYHDLIKSHVPFVMRFAIKWNKKRQDKYLQVLRNKDRIRIVFFFQSASQWKYDKVYHLFEADEKFEPIVVVVPFNMHIYYGIEEYLTIMNQGIEFAKSHGYQYLSSYDPKTKKFIDIKKIINPDIVFFSLPYKNTFYKYHLYNYRDKLCCYVPYSFFPDSATYTTANANLPFHNYLWKFFVDSKFQKSVSEHYALNQGENAEISGCLSMENIIDKAYRPKDVWKPQAKSKKRIIWAPHHTIDYLTNAGTFLIYADFMLSIAEKYKDDIQIAFKPHPVLRLRLNKIWGEEKTNEYYNKWETLENTQLANGSYIDLFLTSDAMIHDSMSFIIEYLFMPDKPVLYLLKDVEKLPFDMNEFGMDGYNAHYHSDTENGIEDFIQKVVLQNKDSLVSQRQDCFKRYLKPIDNYLPSQVVYNAIKNAVGKN